MHRTQTHVVHTRSL